MRLFVVIVIAAMLAGCGVQKPVPSANICPITSFPADFSTAVMAGKIEKISAGKYKLTSRYSVQKSDAYYLLLLKDGIRVDRVYVPAQDTKYGDSAIEFATAEEFNGVAVFHQYRLN